jgi:hypothetical protein
VKAQQLYLNIYDLKCSGISKNLNFYLSLGLLRGYLESIEETTCELLKLGRYSQVCLWGCIGGPFMKAMWEST